MTTEDEIELLGIKLTHTIKMVDLDEHGNAIERRHLIQVIDNIKIEIYSLEHPPPHFHIKSSTLNATFSINSCELLKGNVDSKTFKKIKYFHSLNKPKLVEVWNNLRPTDCPVGPIKI
ncbi:MAG: DUF4160 domain-containing protein [Bacteroidota bacterium]